MWEHYCLERVEYRRRFSHNRASFGEEIDLEIEIVNRKLLPLSWLETEDEIPSVLTPSRGRVGSSYKLGRSLLANLLAFRPYERVRRRYTIPCQARGEHFFGPVRLRSGDLFGFVSREKDLEVKDSLIVYPRVVPLAQLGLPAANPLGDLRASSWIFEDVSRIAGARDYRPGDDLRRIHWPASARSQKLQSRVYEATIDHKLVIFLDLETGEGGWTPGYDPDVLELSITSAASLAKWGLEQGYQTGIYTNGVHSGKMIPVGVEPGRGPAQLERILLALARLQPLVAQRLDQLLRQQAHGLSYGVTAVLVTPALTAQIAGATAVLRRCGHSVAVILTGRKGLCGPVNGIVVRRVGPPESWRDIQMLRAE